MRAILPDVARASRGRGHFLTLSPAAPAAAAHSTISRTMNCANSSGGPPSGSNPCALSLTTTSSDLSAAIGGSSELHDHRARRTGGCHQAEPDAGLEIGQPGLGDGRQVRRGMRAFG